eukprot:8511982-Heterocapsa_arctica.AAC.1
MSWHRDVSPLSLLRIHVCQQVTEQGTRSSGVAWRRRLKVLHRALDEGGRDWCRRWRRVPAGLAGACIG